MNLRSGKWWTMLWLAGLVAGCELDNSGGGEGGAGGGEADGGIGGNAGEGGAGGEAGEGGGGGVGGDPDGPCAQLGEASCTARPDCVAQPDVFGAFSSCHAVDTAACGLLDEARCSDRQDCAWDGERCAEPQLTCADRADEATCERAGCYWYNDACSAERPPMQCDQPDPASCEAAGCAWTEGGCLPQCENLREVACSARNDCRWMTDRCEPTPEGQPCDALGPQDCVGRADCTWHDNTCIDRPAGACAGLDEATCLQRPDCEALYSEEAGGAEGGDQADPPEGGGGAEMPPPLPPEAFLGCQDRLFDCAQVPADACERTPGCGLDEAGQCVSLDPDGCRQLDPRACMQNPRCEYRVEELCDWNGDGIPDEGAGEADRDFAAPPCEVRESCEPRPDAPPACGDLPIDQCFQRFDCMVEADPACGGVDGADRAAPPPPDCVGEDCLIAPACQICVPRPIDLSCWELDQASCFQREDCRWINEGEAGGVPVPLPCDCPPGDPNCACAQDPVPVPPPPGGFCEPIQPQGCWNLALDECQAHPECEWVPGDQDAAEPIEPCECDDAGNCVCGGVMDPDRGFCQDRQQPDPCADLSQDQCMLDHDLCEWLPAPGRPCDCDPDDANCVCPEGAGICVFVGNGLCQAPDADSCLADPACEWVEEAGGCDCVVGPDGEEICQCFGGGGFCQPAAPPGDDCFALVGDACLANNACMMLTCDQACPAGDALCQAQCREEGVEDICFPRAFLCPEAPLDICAQLAGCQVIDPCPPQPDGVACDAEPFCAPE